MALIDEIKNNKKVVETISCKVPYYSNTNRLIFSGRSGKLLGVYNTYSNSSDKKLSVHINADGCSFVLGSFYDQSVLNYPLNLEFENFLEISIENNDSRIAFPVACIQFYN